jgi:hypothetical protein
MRLEEKMRNSAIEAARTPKRREEAEAIGLAATPWEQAQLALAVAEATSYSCSKIPCRNGNRNNPTAPPPPAHLAHTRPERFAPKRASRRIE